MRYLVLVVLDKIPPIKTTELPATVSYHSNTISWAGPFATIEEAWQWCRTFRNKEGETMKYSFAELIILDTAESVDLDKLVQKSVDRIVREGSGTILGWFGSIINEMKKRGYAFWFKEHYGGFELSCLHKSANVSTEPITILTYSMDGNDKDYKNVLLFVDNIEKWLGDADKDLVEKWKEIAATNRFVYERQETWESGYFQYEPRKRALPHYQGARAYDR